MTPATAAAAVAEPTSAAAISVRELTVRFDADAGSITALDRVGFEVPEGGFVTMLGPSGCGKSTLLRAIADLVPIDGGTIGVFSRTPEQARRARDFAFVFQDATLLPWRSAVDNVRLPLEVGRHAGHVKQHAEPEELLALVGLEGREDGRAAGVIVETKEGAQAIRADVVIDATGDLDVAESAGAPFADGAYIVTTVSRMGGVDTDAAERFQFEEPERFAAVDRQAKRFIGGCWQYWWLKTPLPGVVWCNCPHMTGFDGMKVADLTAAEFEGRRRMQALLEFARENVPGFERAYFVDFAPQTGVRQTRLLEGEYVVTKQDVRDRVHFHDSVCRGRDYYTPYRALLPVGVDQMLVAGRHYSATRSAQKMSREIPPCMAMGEAAGIAAAQALDGGVLVRDVDVRGIQRQMRAQGADPGDQPARNALVTEAA